MPPATTNEIAAAALDFYQDKLPTKGKPRETNEWTVYAAIVATTTTRGGTGTTRHAQQEQVTVISCATGTKCTAVNKGTTATVAAEAVLHDSHAEVLARRGLLRVLWQEIMSYNDHACDDENKTSDDGKKNNVKMRLLTEVSRDKFRLRSDMRLHLYVSDSPCGDASIYPVMATLPSTGPSAELKAGAGAAAAVAVAATSSESPPTSATKEDTLRFTGAKVIVSAATKVSVEDCGVQAYCLNDDDKTSTRNPRQLQVAREPTVQLLGCLRTKSGRSNLQPGQRSDSMSCSDKIVRWCILGLQGQALLHYLVEPIRLSSILVSRDGRCPNASAQLVALQRAIPDRVRAVVDEVRANCRRHGRHADTAWDIASIYLEPPQVQVVDRVFARGKASSEQQQMAPFISHTGSRKRKHEESEDDKGKVSPHDTATAKKVSPTGVALNWNVRDDSVEITIGARGIRQGKKPKTDKDLLALASRLSRRGLWKDVVAGHRHCRDQHEEKDNTPSSLFADDSYDEFKRKQMHMDEWRRHIFSHGPLAGWIVSGDNPGHEKKQRHVQER